MTSDLTSSDNDYHGIIIREGIRDQTTFDEMNVLGQKTGKKWTLVKVGIESNSIARAIGLIQENLLSESGVPYYAHFYRDDELIVVFPEKIFHISPDKNTWKDSVCYGESLGIPRIELDFRPCRFKDETF